MSQTGHRVKLVVSTKLESKKGAVAQDQNVQSAADMLSMHSVGWVVVWRTHLDRWRFALRRLRDGSEFHVHLLNYQPSVTTRGDLDHLAYNYLFI